MLLKPSLNILLLFIVFFVITYFEDRYIGGLSFASIWKIPFIIYWIWYTYLLNPKDSSKFSFIMLGGIFCFLMPIHSNMMNSIIPEVTDTLKYLIIPSLFYYLIKRFDNNPYIIMKMLFWLAAFLIWTNIPYLLDIIKPKVQLDYSDLFGEGMLEDAGFSGPYMTVHSQAVFMSCALLFIIFLVYKYPKQFPIRHWFLVTTICIGSYSLYLSYARTGWLFFIVGVIIILSDNFNWKKIRRSFPLILIFIIGLIYLYNTNTSIQRRINDERQYGPTDRVDQIGSGRIVFGTTALANWSESQDIFSVLLGYGSEKGKDKMQEKIGVRLFAHNAFIEILQRCGAIGLLLFLIFSFKLFNFCKKFKKSSFFNLLLTFFLGWIIVGTVQEFTFIYLNVMFAGILALTYLTSRKITKKEEYFRKIDLNNKAIKTTATPI